MQNMKSKGLNLLSFQAAEAIIKATST